MERLKAHYKKKGKWALVFDILFYGLILLFLIPGTRKKSAPLFIKSTLHPPLSIHAPANNKLSEADFQWPLQDLSGNPYSLAQDEKKVIFLNFWATWCPPCIAELPSIQRLYDHYGENISFLLVSQEKPEVVQAFLQKNHYTFPVHIQTIQSPTIFQTRSIPTSFIISPEGKIVMEKKGAAKWDSKKIVRFIDKMLERNR